MTFRYEGDLVAPVLQTGQEIAEYGFDRSALRNHLDQLVLSGPQLRGNIRQLLLSLFGVEKMHDITASDLDVPEIDVSLSSEDFVKLFGKEHAASPADLKFFDAILGRRPKKGEEVKPITGTGKASVRSGQDELKGGPKHGFVFTSETHFEPEEKLRFSGHGYLVVDTQKTGKDLCNLLQWAGKQIPMLGADKTAGFGRMTGFRVSEPELRSLWDPKERGTAKRYEMNVTSEHPLLVSPRVRNGNVLESLNFIPGNVMFGAVDDWLELCGKKSDFAKVLNNIRLLHAYPAPSNANQRIGPGSLMEFEASASGPNLARDSWKENPVGEDGLALSVVAERVLRTRTTISGGGLTPESGELFTTSSLSPVGRKWIGGIEWTGDDEPSDDFQELVAALRHGLPRLGKGAAPISLEMKDMPNAGEVKSSNVTVTLVSDAWIIEPEDNGWTRDGYQRYFQEHLGERVSLRDFAARQSFRATPKTRHGDTGWPLTLAGSVFELEGLDEFARNELSRFVVEGLPPVDPKISFEDCPFVAANGYGEIVVGTV